MQNNENTFHPFPVIVIKFVSTDLTIPNLFYIIKKYINYINSQP